MSHGDLPETIGRYRPLEELGRGSMARVLLARDPNTDRRVALKVVAPVVEGEDEAQRRFLLEARAAGRLNHPGIVTIYDADVDPATGDAYMAMEWVRGRSLARVLEEDGPLPAAEAVRIASAVAEALDHAHGRDVIHRDVKPANILLGDDGAVKVSDFGIAKFVAESHTLWGQVLGSPNYMSPEQVTGEPMDGRSDLFSLAAVVYEMVTGVPPFRGESVASIVYKIAHVDPRPPSFQDPTLGPALGDVLLRALDKDPTHRFGTGAELARALRRALEADAAGVRLSRDGRIERAGHGAARPADAAQEADPAFAETLVDSSVALEGPAEDAAETPGASESEGRDPGQARGRRLNGRRIGRRIAAVVLVVAALGVLGVAALALWDRGSPEDAVSGPPSRQASTQPHSQPAPPRPAPAEPAGESDGQEKPSPESDGSAPGTESPAAPDASPPPEPVEDAEGGPAESTGESVAGESGAGAAGEPAAPAEPATLRLVYNNRLANALLTVWVDGERALSYRVRTEELFDRVTGDELTTALEVEPGVRTVEIRVTGVEGRNDASGVLRSRFRSGQTRRLRIVLRPFGSRLRLVWED